MLVSFIEARNLVGRQEATCIISTMIILPILKGVDIIEVIYRNAIPMRYIEDIRNAVKNFN